MTSWLGALSTPPGETAVTAVWQILLTPPVARRGMTYDAPRKYARLIAPRHAPIADSLVRAAAPRSTDDVLELGAGTGLVTARAAPSLRSLLATDASKAKAGWTLRPLHVGPDVPREEAPERGPSVGGRRTLSTCGAFSRAAKSRASRLRLRQTHRCRPLESIRRRRRLPRVPPRVRRAGYVESGLLRTLSSRRSTRGMPDGLRSRFIRPGLDADGRHRTRPAARPGQAAAPYGSR